ncbi:MAG: hypothetical protein PHQ53_01135 [Candidatus Krumholzibacteria bacterium]|nr:hypothetical protein [Candidatus Krumholzibacteria bacterium]
MDDLLLPSAFLIVVGSLIALIGTQMTGKARRATRAEILPADQENPLGRGKAVMAGGWFVFLLGLLGLLAVKLV